MARASHSPHKERQEGQEPEAELPMFLLAAFLPPIHLFIWGLDIKAEREHQTPDPAGRGRGSSDVSSTVLR